MALKLIGIDGSGRINGNVIPPRINPSDFRGQAFEIQAMANNAQYEAAIAMLRNQAATEATLKRSEAESLQTEATLGRGGGGGSRGGGGGKSFDPSLDVSEREKFEYEKQKDAQKFGLDSSKESFDQNMTGAKFKEDIYRDRRDFAFKAGTDARDFGYKAAKDNRDFEFDVDKFRYQVGKDQKAERSELEYAAAQRDIEESTLQLQTALRSGGGMSEVRDVVSSILQRYPGLSGDAKRDLIKQAYQPAQEVTKEQIQRTQKKIEEVQGYNRQTGLAQERLKLQGLFTRLKTATGGQRSNLLGTIQSQLGSIATNADIDPLDKAYIVSQLTQDVVTSGQYGSEAADLMNRYDNYTREAASLHAKRSSMSSQEYAYRESRLASQFGVTGSGLARMDDPMFNEKKVRENLQMVNDIKQLQQRNQLDNQFGISASRGAVGKLAKQYATPAGIEALKSYAQRNGNQPGLAEAVKVAQDLFDFKEQHFATQQKADEYNKEIALLQASSATTVLGILSDGKANLNTMAIMQTLAPEIRNALLSGQGLSPAQQQQFVSNYKEARERAVDYAQRQRNAELSKLQVKREYLELYVGRDQFAAFEAFKQSGGKKAAPQQQRQPKGVSPKRSPNQAPAKPMVGIPSPQSDAQFINNALGVFGNGTTAP